MIRKLLKGAYENKNLIGVTTKEIEWDESIIGYIIDLNEDYFTINEIDEYGVYIGNTIIAINEVCHVEPDNWYIRNLESMLKEKCVFDPNIRVTIWKTGKELKTHLQFAKDNAKITRFFFEDENFVIGIVSDFDDNHILVKHVGQDGTDEGTSCYQICDIVGMRYDGLKEQKIKFIRLFNRTDLINKSMR